MKKIKVVKGIAILDDQEWKYFCKKNNSKCLFVDQDDNVIEIEKTNLEFMQDDSGKSYAYNLLTNRNRKHEKERIENWWDTR